MKSLLEATSCVLALGYLPLSLFLKYLILERIGATDLMWFVFIIEIPFIIVISAVSVLIRKASKDI